MELTVLVEPAAGDRRRAIAGAPFMLETEGADREEALLNLRDMIEEELVAGAELTTLPISEPANSWARFAGTLKDDPVYDEWVKAMADYRLEIDENPEKP